MMTAFVDVICTNYQGSDRLLCHWDAEKSHDSPNTTRTTRAEDGLGDDQHMFLENVDEEGCQPSQICGA